MHFGQISVVLTQFVMICSACMNTLPHMDMDMDMDVGSRRYA